MADIDLTLDTAPLANTLSGVSKHVSATTVAVTAMEAAVIKAERDSADRVCQNVDKGFYSLIRSQVSAKLAEHFTAMNASFNLLMQYSKSLSSTGNRMEADVNRLKRQYYKIFHGLDKSLENRVAQLDREAMQLASMRKQIITDRSLKKVANTVCAEREASAARQMMVTARLKERTRNALNAVGDNLIENGEYLNGVSNLLHDGNSESLEQLYVPVICVEEQSQVLEESTFAHAYYPEYLSQQTKNQLESRINSNAAELLENQENMMNSDRVRSEFRKLADSSGLDERTVEMMMNLYKNGGVK